MSIKFCKLILLSFLINSFIFPIYKAHAADVDVIWTDLVGATASGNDITKTASNGWGTGGSASTVSHTGTFAVEFTTDSSAVNKLFGLSDTNTNANYNTIDFAIYINTSSNIQVYENGTSKGTFGGYTVGDTLKIDRTGTTITYRKNNTTFYTSTTSSTGSLLADTALYYTNSKFIDAKFIGVPATEPAVITDLTGTFGDGEITLNWSAPSNNGSAITSYEVQYGVVSTGTFDLTHSDNATPGATITGLVNGTYYQFRVVAVNSLGSGTPSNVVKLVPNETIDVVWENLVGVSASGNDITKTAGNGWGTGGATSDHYYNGNIAVMSTIDQLYAYRMIGFSSKNLNADYTTIEYAIYLHYNNHMQVYENGTYKAQGPTFTTGDVISVHRSDGVVAYRKNDVTFYTSAATTTKDLLVDTAIYTYNGKLNDVRIAQHGGYPVTNEIEFGDTIEQTTVTNNGTFGYDFHADNGDKLIIPLANSGGSFSPKLELFNPGGTEVDQVITTTGTILYYTTQTTGTFSLLLSDDGANQTGTFNFTLQKENEPGKTEDLDFGGSINDVVNPGADIDAVKFSALDGDSVSFILTTPSPSYSIKASLYDVTGTLLGETTATASVQGTIGFPITADGDYYVLIKSATTGQVGYYTISLEENLVTSVFHTGSAFDPAASETATINFFLDRDADVTIKLYTPHYAGAGYWRTYYDTILDDDPRSAGSNSFVWDGKDSSGNIVPSGGYVYTVESVSPGRTDLYDPVYVYGFVETNNGSMTPANFDPNIGETATISYDLPVPAFVSIDIGVVGTMLPWRRLILTQPRDDGTNTEIWDGRDTNGNIMGFDDIQAIGWAVLLPDNTIIVGNNSGMAVDSVFADPYAFFPVYGEATQISFDLAEESDVTLEIVDTNDTVVITLIDDELTSAGTHTVEWDGRNELNKVPVEQGLYTIRLTVSQASGPQVLIREGNVTVFR